MGRIKTTAVKRVSEDLVSEHFDKFSEKYQENKKVVEKLADIPSKKLRNIITGYVTRLVKSKETL